MAIIPDDEKTKKTTFKLVRKENVDISEIMAKVNWTKIKVKTSKKMTCVTDTDYLDSYYMYIFLKKKQTFQIGCPYVYRLS